MSTQASTRHQTGIGSWIPLCRRLWRIFVWRWNLEGARSIAYFAKKLPIILKAWIRFRAENTNPSPEAQRRLDTCKCCLVFHPSLETCGGWTDDAPKGQEFLRHAGCGCYMPWKVFLPQATCWMRDQDMPEADGGWPDEINGEKELRNL